MKQILTHEKKKDKYQFTKIWENKNAQTNAPWDIKQM